MQDELERLPSKQDKTTQALFRAATTSVLGDGESTQFWEDRWLEGQALRHQAPALYAATNTAGRRMSVAKALQDHAWARRITGALTVNVILDYIMVWESTSNV